MLFSEFQGFRLPIHDLDLFIFGAAHRRQQTVYIYLHTRRSWFCVILDGHATRPGSFVMNIVVDGRFLSRSLLAFSWFCARVAVLRPPVLAFHARAFLQLAKGRKALQDLYIRLRTTGINNLRAPRRRCSTASGCRRPSPPAAPGSRAVVPYRSYMALRGRRRRSWFLDERLPPPSPTCLPASSNSDGRRAYIAPASDIFGPFCVFIIFCA